MDAIGRVTPTPVCSSFYYPLASLVVGSLSLPPPTRWRRPYSSAHSPTRRTTARKATRLISTKWTCRSESPIPFPTDERGSSSAHAVPARTPRDHATRRSSRIRAIAARAWVCRYHSILASKTITIQLRCQLASHRHFAMPRRQPQPRQQPTQQSSSCSTRSGKTCAFQLAIVCRAYAADTAEWFAN